MIIPQKKLERKLFKSGYKNIYAVDEVGMGCLAGPVVVCAVKMTKDFYNKNSVNLKGLRDSKLLSEKQREKFSSELINKNKIVYSIAYSYPKKIDNMNIYNTARSAMLRAIKKLNSKYSIRNTKSVVLIDGPHKIKGLNFEQIPIIKGDRKVFAIACASILAKVYRDRMMIKYAKRFPNYGFEVHKGYGTKFHRARLVALGPCDLHRRSFRLKY